MSQETIDALYQIIDLNRQKYTAIKTVRNTNSTKINRVLMAVDSITKEQKVSQLNRIFRAKAKSAYDALNADRLEHGLPMITNPYMKGKNENEN